MKLYISKTHSDEDGQRAEEGKLGIVYGSKDEILKLCEFFKQVEKQIKNNSICHMHLRDNYDNWNKEEQIDLEINLE